MTLLRSRNVLVKPILQLPIQIEGTRSPIPIDAIIMHSRSRIRRRKAGIRSRSITGFDGLIGVEKSTSVAGVEVGLRRLVAEPFDIDFLVVGLVEEHSCSSVLDKKSIEIRVLFLFTVADARDVGEDGIGLDAGGGDGEVRTDFAGPDDCVVLLAAVDEEVEIAS